MKKLSPIELRMIDRISTADIYYPVVGDEILACRRLVALGLAKKRYGRLTPNDGFQLTDKGRSIFSG